MNFSAIAHPLKISKPKCSGTKFSFIWGFCFNLQLNLIREIGLRPRKSLGYLHQCLDYFKVKTKTLICLTTARKILPICVFDLPNGHVTLKTADLKNMCSLSSQPAKVVQSKITFLDSSSNLLKFNSVHFDHMILVFGATKEFTPHYELDGINFRHFGCEQLSNYEFIHSADLTANSTNIIITLKL